MQTKEEQIEELKATAAKLQQQIEALEKPEQWEPAYTEYVPHTHSEAKALRTYCRLAAYVREFGGDWEADWEDNSQLKYCVYYGYYNRVWSLSNILTICIVGTVYMSQDCAEGLVEKLNSGEVTL